MAPRGSGARCWQPSPAQAKHRSRLSLAAPTAAALGGRRSPRVCFEPQRFATSISAHVYLKFPLLRFCKQNREVKKGKLPPERYKLTK